MGQVFNEEELWKCIDDDPKSALAKETPHWFQKIHHISWEHSLLSSNKNLGVAKKEAAVILHVNPK